MTLLTVEGLSAGYEGRNVLHEISFELTDGEITVVLGANGAGKTTLLKALDGTIESSGSVVFDGIELVGRKRSAALLGIAHVPEGRGTFGALTVEENLRIGGYRRTSREVERSIEEWYSFFPRLRERARQSAAGLSGGEQQMLAIARSLMSRPRLLLLDEPSLGLAPNLTAFLFASLRTIRERTGTTVLLVEQNAHLSLPVADHAFVMTAGRSGPKLPAKVLRGDAQIQRAYLGT